MCPLKTTTVPVILEALGLIKKSTDKHINLDALQSQFI